MVLGLMLFSSMTVTAMAGSFQVTTDKDKVCAGDNVTVTIKLDKALEGNYRKIVGSMKVYLRVIVMPDDAPEQKKVYMPSEQAKELMAQNEEVKSLVKDLELDIK